METSNTNWNLYRSFLEVYETKHLPSAAERLGIIRSAVGHNIQALSKQLGVKLFTPTKKGVEPTSEALALYPAIKKAVEIIIDSERSIEEFSSSSSALIRIRIPTTIVSILFDDFLKHFNQKYPLVRFQFYDRATDEADLILTFGLEIGADFSMLELFELNHIFIASKDFIENNQLKTHLTKAELLKLPIIAHGHSYNILQNEFGLDFTPLVKSISAQTVFALTKNGIGIGHYYDKIFAKQNDKNMARIFIDDISLPAVKLTCYFKKSRTTKAARVFIEELKRFCSAHL